MERNGPGSEPGAEHGEEKVGEHGLEGVAVDSREQDLHDRVEESLIERVDHQEAHARIEPSSLLEQKSPKVLELANCEIA